MSIIEAVGNGKGDLLDKWNHKFVGDASDEDVYTSWHHPVCGLHRTCRLASPVHPKELEEDPCMEEIEWGTGSLLDPAQTLGHDRAYEGHDRRVHRISEE